MEEAKAEVMEFVDFLRNPSKYSDLGAKIPKVCEFCHVHVPFFDYQSSGIPYHLGGSSVWTTRHGEDTPGQGHCH